MKTAQELDISEDERKYLEAAIPILESLEPGQRIRLPDDGFFQFDMSDVGYAIMDPNTNRECGTAGCIYGLARILARLDGSKAFQFHSWPPRRVLDPLFFPTTVEMSEVTPRIAAAVTRRFLETGEISFDGFGLTASEPML